MPHERWTVAAYLEHWLAEVVRPTLAPRTYQGYEAVARRHLVPVIGHRPLAMLSTRDVHRVLAQVRASGASPRQVQWVHAVLRTALTCATREELTTRNVAMLVHTPTVLSRVGRALSVPETQRLLQAAAGDRLEAVFVLAVHLGLRQAELLGLRWADVDLAAGRLEVVHSLQRVDGRLTLVVPKTSASRRTLPLPAPVIAALIEHRARQAGERHAVAEGWVDSGMVFTTAVGGPLGPDAVRRSWVRIRPAVTGPVRLLSRLGARFRCYHRPVSPSRSPNPPCQFLGNGLSTVSAVRRGSWSARGLGSCCPGRRSGRPSRLGAGST